MMNHPSIRTRVRAACRKNPRRIFALMIAVAALSVSLPTADPPRASASAQNPLPPHHLAEGFRNLNPDFMRASHLVRLGYFFRGLASAWNGSHHVAPLSLVNADVNGLRLNGHDATVTWIGHSTLLVQLDGVNFLTDPHWGFRTGPFGGKIGVRRYTPPGLPIEELPEIDFVLISHDHYDHLDEPTVIRLAELYHPLFIVPLGLKSWLADRKIGNAVELDWGESINLKGLTIVCTPAQHYSGRTPMDQGRRLWSSWAVLGSKRFYFGGDSGYYTHFKGIGEAYGPFDLAALAIGSYTPPIMAKAVHTSPEEALQAWIDLRASRFIGIHWGTFALARERYDEPPARLAAEATRRHLDPTRIWVLKPGETQHW